MSLQIVLDALRRLSLQDFDYVSQQLSSIRREVAYADARDTLLAKLSNWGELEITINYALFDRIENTEAGVEHISYNISVGDSQEFEFKAEYHYPESGEKRMVITTPFFSLDTTEPFWFDVFYRAVLEGDSWRSYLPQSWSSNVAIKFFKDLIEKSVYDSQAEHFHFHTRQLGNKEESMMNFYQEANLLSEEESLREEERNIDEEEQEDLFADGLDSGDFEESQSEGEEELRRLERSRPFLDDDEEDHYVSPKLEERKQPKEEDKEQLRRWSKPARAAKSRN